MSWYRQFSCSIYHNRDDVNAFWQVETALLCHGDCRGRHEQTYDLPVFLLCASLSDLIRTINLHVYN